MTPAPSAHPSVLRCPPQAWCARGCGAHGICVCAEAGSLSGQGWGGHPQPGGGQGARWAGSGSDPAGAGWTRARRARAQPCGHRRHSGHGEPREGARARSRPDRASPRFRPGGGLRRPLGVSRLRSRRRWDRMGRFPTVLAAACLERPQRSLRHRRCRAEHASGLRALLRPLPLLGAGKPRGPGPGPGSLRPPPPVPALTHGRPRSASPPSARRSAPSAPAQRSRDAAGPCLGPLHRLREPAAQRGASPHPGTPTSESRDPERTRQDARPPAPRRAPPALSGRRRSGRPAGVGRGAGATRGEESVGGGAGVGTWSQGWGGLGQCQGSGVG